MASRSEPAPTGWDSRITSGEGLLVSIFVHGSSFSAAWLWHVVGVVGVVTRGSSRCVGAHIHGHMRSLRAQAVTSLVMEGSVAPSMFAVFFLLVTVRLMRRLQRCLAP